MEKPKFGMIGLGTMGRNFLLNVAEHGVPTEILAKAVEVERSVETVARWYGTSKREVEAAVEFQQKIAA